MKSISNRLKRNFVLQWKSKLHWAAVCFYCQYIFVNLKSTQLVNILRMHVVNRLLYNKYFKDDSLHVNLSIKRQYSHITHTPPHTGCLHICVSSGIKGHLQPLDKKNALLSFIRKTNRKPKYVWLCLFTQATHMCTLTYSSRQLQGLHLS